MILDLETADAAPDTYDVCIIGAGAAGITLASDLVRRRRRVLLLEAGGRRPERASSAIVEAESVGLLHKGVNAGRFRVLGGATTEWGGQILELDDIDFRERAWVPGSGWPIAKSSLAPYYRRVIDFIGLQDALQDDSEVWRALGRSAPEVGPDLIPVFSRWCPERNFAALQAGLLETHPELVVYLHANALSFKLDENGSRVTSVGCRTLGGKSAEFRADRFVLCLGGIETSRFLLQPAERAQPWCSNGMVGRHFVDHIVCSGARLHETTLQPPQDYFDYVRTGGFRFHPKLKLSEKAQERLGTLNVCGTMAILDRGHAIADEASLAMRRWRNLGVRGIGLKGMAALAAEVGRRAVTRVLRNTDPAIVLRVHTEQAPLSGSRITLSGQRDALGQFRARIDWRTDPLELATVRRFVEVFRVTFAKRGLGRMDPLPALADDDLLTRSFEDSIHHMGGTRMSVRPGEGVVDPQLRLHGLKNTYVCSSSVFPTSGFSNPTHTLLALTLRLGEHIGDLPSSRSVAHSIGLSPTEPAPAYGRPHGPA